MIINSFFGVPWITYDERLHVLPTARVYNGVRDGTYTTIIFFPFLNVKSFIQYTSVE